MQLYHITLNSLWRRKTRLIFLLLGLTIAVSTVVILWSISRAMNADIAQKLDEYGANILIVPKSDDLALTYGGMSVAGVRFDQRELHTSDVESIRTIKNKDNISIVAPKLLNVAELQSRRVMVVGIDFAAETRLKKWWKIAGSIPQNNAEALVGADVAVKLNINVGDNITINGQDFVIRGVLQETGSQDDALIFIDLEKAQTLFNKPAAISLIEVAALCYDCPIEEIVSQTSEKLPGAKVTAIRQTIESKMTAMHQFEQFSIGISVVMLLVGGLIVFTTMSASVNDRRKEIGLFRSIGFRQKDILQIILLEAIILSALAGLVGATIGFLVSQNIAPLVDVQVPLTRHDLSILGFAILLSVIIGVCAAFYPSLKAAKLDPTTALRAL
jgi:putative ABC transport system permease protein